MSELSAMWGGPVKPVGRRESRHRQAIAALPAIYALGLDLGDLELCRSAFAPDAVAGSEGGELVGIDEHLAMLERLGSSAESRQHVIGQQLVRVDGDRAEMWSSGLGIRDRRVVSGQQSRDTCRRFSAGWLITERRISVQWLDLGAT